LHSFSRSDHSLGKKITSTLSHNATTDNYLRVTNAGWTEQIDMFNLMGVHNFISMEEPIPIAITFALPTTTMVS